MTSLKQSPRQFFIERSIEEAFIHPKYLSGTAHYDVGVVIAGTLLRDPHAYYADYKSSLLSIMRQFSSDHLQPFSWLNTILIKFSFLVTMTSNVCEDFFYLIPLFWLSDRPLVFEGTLAPVCLPFRPIDDNDFLKGASVTSAGWEKSQIATNGDLWISNAEVE